MLISLHCSPMRFYAFARMRDEAVKYCGTIKFIKIKRKIGMCFFCRHAFSIAHIME